MELTPDQTVYLQWGVVKVNATLAFTWAVMALLAAGAWAVTRNLTSGVAVGRGQSLLESVVDFVRRQIEDTVGGDAGDYLPFVGTLLLFIAASNFLSFVPGYHPPTASLSTTAAFALCVFLAVPAYGIAHRGLKGYLRHYVEPTPFMLPFHAIGEVSRTLALAVRLFGNVMSGTLLVAILLSIAPLFFPVLLHALELLIGQVQAYIFAVLATVYIASAAQTQGRTGQRGQAEDRQPKPEKDKDDKDEPQ